MPEREYTERRPERGVQVDAGGLAGTPQDPERGIGRPAEPEEWKPTVCWTLVLQSRQRLHLVRKRAAGAKKTMEAND